MSQVHLATNASAEPSRNTGLSVSAITTVVGVLALFGINVPPNVRELILLAISVFGPMICGLLIRAKVFSPAVVARIKAQQEQDANAASLTITQLTAEKTALQTAHEGSIAQLPDAIEQIVRGIVPFAAMAPAGASSSANHPDTYSGPRPQAQSRSRSIGPDQAGGPGYNPAYQRGPQQEQQGQYYEEPDDYGRHNR